LTDNAVAMLHQVTVGRTLDCTMHGTNLHFLTTAYPTNQAQGCPNLSGRGMSYRRNVSSLKRLNRSDRCYLNSNMTSDSFQYI